MIVDVHYHVGRQAKGRWDLPIDQQWLTKEMAMFGIDKTIVFPYRAVDSYQPLNTELLDHFAGPNIIPFARIRFSSKRAHCLTYLSTIKIPRLSARALRVAKEISNRSRIAPFHDDGLERDLFTRAMANFSGIKFHDNQDGQITEERFEFLLSFGKPIVVHMNPYKLEYFLSRFRGSVVAPVVIAHLGANDGDSLYLDKTRTMLSRFEYLFTDTAAHVAANHLMPFLQSVPNKVLFGSDGPVVSQGSTLCLWQQASRALFGDAEKAFGAIERASRDFLSAAGWTA